MNNFQKHAAAVLLIDDQTMAADLVRHILQDIPDIRFDYLQDASRILDVAALFDPTIVLVDLRMPGTDGFEVIQRLRANPATECVPIVLLSSEEDADIKAHAFAAGANDYLVKWPDKRELIARIRYHSGAFLARKERDEAFLSLRRSQEELAESQAALHQAQKIEAIGQLTGGVAHDFNNVLQIISGNLQLLRLLANDHAAIQTRVDAALAGVDRGAKLAAHLLAFARRQPLQPIVVNAGAVLRNMDDLLRRTLGQQTMIETAIADDLWSTAVDPSQLENVILNLAINARDAMIGGLAKDGTSSMMESMADGGKLTIRASNFRCRDAGEALPASVDFTSNEYVLIEIGDTGSGMPADVRERAFEPFFTTKPAGQGTGLGLSMVYGFVKQSEGEIVLESTPGKGTTVKVFLPRSTGPVEPGEELPLPQMVGGVETILVVEDEPAVRATTVELLSSLGYLVLEAANAACAIEIIDAGTPIDLVFTDVIMPGKASSLDLTRHVKTRLPDAQILFTSGYAEGVIAHDGKVDPSVSLLSKPYSGDVLAARIRHMLRRRKTAAAA